MFTNTFTIPKTLLLEPLKPVNSFLQSCTIRPYFLQYPFCNMIQDESMSIDIVTSFFSVFNRAFVYNNFFIFPLSNQNTLPLYHIYGTWPNRIPLLHYHNERLCGMSTSFGPTYSLISLTSPPFLLVLRLGFLPQKFASECQFLPHFG